MIDGNLIRERRIERGLSQIELARRAALHCGVLAEIERTGTVGEVSIGQLERIRNALGLPPTTQPNTLDPSTDVATLGAMIGRVETNGRRVCDLGWALGWPQSRLEAAIDELRQHLTKLGQALVVDGNGALQIEPADISDASQAISGLPSRDKSGDLSAQEKGVVLMLARTCDWEDPVLLLYFSLVERRAIDRLVKRGYVTVTDNCVELGEIALTSLAPVLDKFRLSRK